MSIPKDRSNFADCDDSFLLIGGGTTPLKSLKIPISRDLFQFSMCTGPYRALNSPSNFVTFDMARAIILIC